jgi:hypothetical protein
MFCKRHYEAIAQAMQDAQLNQPEEAKRGVARAVGTLADLFARDNDLFKRDRFERACMPGANVRARS